MIRFIITTVVSACALALFSGCQPSARDRAYGYFRLGKVSDLQAAETYFQDKGLLLTLDERGYSVMSTMCTFDLSLLTLDRTGGSLILRSQLTSSTYAQDGKVLKGPATENLPYYQVELKPGGVDPNPDTLFVRVNRKVEPSWRLKVVVRSTQPE